MKKHLKLCLVFLLLGSTSAFAQPELKAKFIKKNMEKVTKWQLEHPRHADTDWTNGAFYAGVVEAYKTTGKQWILDSLIAMGEAQNWEPAARYDHADDIAISQTYLAIYDITKDRSIIEPTLNTLKKLQSVPGKEVANHGITWWWCDALFMAPPVLAKMANITDDNSLRVFNDKLYKECYELLYNEEEDLFARDASYLMDKNGKIKLEDNGKKIFWSRGNGWVMGGLVKLLQELPADYPNRPFYENLYKEMAAKLISIQQPDGLWRSSLLDPTSFPGGEASGSGFDLYALAYGVNNGLLPSSYTPNIVKGWVALNGLVNDEGRVGWVQPIGADPRRNFDKDSWEVFGSGAYLLAGSEVIKLKR